jgi:hypothetical protein
MIKWCDNMAFILTLVHIIGTSATAITVLMYIK